MTPIEIAGEWIEAADWPVDIRFFCESSDDHFFDHGGITQSIEDAASTNDHPINERARGWLPIIAAVARCHFLDKAEAAKDNTNPYQEPYCGDVLGWMERNSAILQQKSAYLASAAKWARIGRAK